MKNVYIYCEGQTEESFINKVLYSYFQGIGIYVRPIVCETKRTISKKYRGGVSSYAKIKNELTKIAAQHHNEYVTTMFDYYGMPSDTPDISNNEPDIYKRIKSIEASINSDIDKSNCDFYLMLHEFEAILFSEPDSFRLIADDTIVDQIWSIKTSFATPEHINNSPKTAPSKRIEALMPGFAKTKNGTILAENVGIDAIMKQCVHFREWIQTIKDRAST